MIILRRIYSLYCLFIFAWLFLLLLPLFIILIQRKSWHRPALWLNHFWARAFFLLCFIPVKREFRFKPDPGSNYIFCANHFSFLDIPTIGLTPVPFVFVGKNSMSRIPVFGYMYKKLHILVDRSKLRSKYETLQRSIETLESGLSLAIFPEGGIITQNPPDMAAFKPGAFKAAILKNIPIVPVTIPFNWKFLPDDSKFLPNYGPVKIIYHQPIDTSGYTINTMNELNSKVFNIIADELKRMNANGSN